MRLAIDVGGTFTDLVLSVPGRGRITHKVRSTAPDPSAGVLSGIARLADDLGSIPRELLMQVDTIMHGTTIATNALVTRTGARVGLITTEGFRDVLGMRQSHRERQWDSRSTPPAPLTPRAATLTVRERVDASGAIRVALHEEDVIGAANVLRDQGVEAVAVAYLFSFLRPEHERRTAELLTEALPDVYLSVSADLVPEVRLYDRASTAVANAYVGPVLQRYLQALEARLRESGYGGAILVMQSSGGVVPVRRAAREAVGTLLSGPAGAPVAVAERVRAPLSAPKALAIDMGGTSFEAALVVDGATELRKGGELSGVRIATRMLDISTIGAGGGSIASVTAGGALRVGPASAGADPGPASYGRGGSEATVTDANVVLGYLPAGATKDAPITLDADAAHAAVSRLGDRLGLEPLNAAVAIRAAINGSMADSLRLATLRRGLDPREFALVAAGGAGPLHAADLARDVESPLVIVPRDAPTLCAAGMLATDVTRHSVRPFAGDAADPDTETVEEAYEELERAAAADFAADGLDPATLRLTRSADLRYAGQIHELEIELPTSGRFDEGARTALAAAFADRHEHRFGHRLEASAIELVAVRLRATSPTGDLHSEVAPDSEVVVAETARRAAWFDGRLTPTPAHRGDALRPGTVVTGPALIDQRATTIVVPSDFAVHVADARTLVLHAIDRPVDEALDRLGPVAATP